MSRTGSKATVVIRFDSPKQLRNEFERNISNGGIFVPSERDFSIREPIVVQIELAYAAAPDEPLCLDGEVVHRIPAELASSGGVPGVAIQFEATADRLRDLFTPMLGEEAAVLTSNVDTEGARRREGKRRAVRVPIRVMPASSPPFEATSHDLSATGILIAVDEGVLRLNEVLRVCLWNPSGEASVEVDGKVVREVRNKKGRIAAVAVAFDRNQASEPRVSKVIQALSQAGHNSRLGGISGSISDLGLANLVQMFGSSTPRGTVVCEREGEQGWIVFDEGALVSARLGALRGHDALVSMLDWADGRFEFEASADERLLKSADRRPLTGAILEAVCAIDERETGRSGDAASSGADWAEQTCVMAADESMPTPRTLGPESVFDVDPDREASMLGTLGKVEEAVLELAKSGAPVSKLLAIIPEAEAEVYRALEELVESGVLGIR
jgi:Tfp pilus assembly protein PilZ